MMDLLRHAPQDGLRPALSPQLHFANVEFVTSVQDTQANNLSDHNMLQCQ